MNRLLWTALGLLVLTAGSLFAAGPMDPSSFRQFSADMTVTSQDSTMTARYHRDGDRIRFEPVSMAEKGKEAIAPQMAMIIDAKNRTVMVIMHPQKMVMDMPAGVQMPGQPSVPQTPMDVQVVSRRTLGEETVAGHATVVEEMVVKDSSGSQSAIRVWSARDLDGFPIQVRNRDAAGREATVTFTNVKLGAPDRKLFETPPGYKRMAMPPQMGQPASPPFGS